MTDLIGRIQSGAALIAVVGFLGGAVTSARADDLRRAGTAIAIGVGETNRISPEEARDRGIKLRAELDQAFNLLPDTTKAGHADELTAIVRPYISAGTALEDAEAILRAAGFAEPPSPRVHQDQDRNKDWYGVVAEIPQFSGRVFGNVEVYAMLLPPDEGLAEFVGRRHRLMYYPRR